MPFFFEAFQGFDHWRFAHEKTTCMMMPRARVVTFVLFMIFLFLLAKLHVKCSGEKERHKKRSLLSFLLLLYFFLTLPCKVFRLGVCDLRMQQGFFPILCFLNFIILIIIKLSFSVGVSSFLLVPFA